MLNARKPKLKIIHVHIDGYEAAALALSRSLLQDNPAAEETVKSIIQQVRSKGDEALLELGRKFDCSQLSELEVTQDEWDEACHRVSDKMKDAIRAAKASIQAFHEKQKRNSWVSAEPGMTVGQLIRPLGRVGIYVPGGTAVYPSSVLMSGIPAKVAGVKELFICTPCGKDGRISPLVLYAARETGVDRVFKSGGAQAIAAMALGTKTIPSVDKIVGPGNVYVNIAKKMLWGLADIDMLAGPSEVCIVADEGANPAYAASDMLAQSEHDTECAAFLITPSERMAKETEKELRLQLAALPRKEILQKALEAHGAIVVTESLEQAFDLANVCAPEHLALMVRDPFSALGRIRNAGAILMGDNSPQTLGDYYAGPSHTLPTSGTARFSSPLNVDTFLKKTSYISYDQASLSRVAPILMAFAEEEGFEAHASAVKVRLNDKVNH
jgi:histidinol dehydrogenase